MSKNNFSVSFPSDVRQVMADADAITSLLNKFSEFGTSVGTILSIKVSNFQEQENSDETSETVTIRYTGGMVFRAKVRGWSSHYGYHHETTSAQVSFKADDLCWGKKIKVSLSGLAIYKACRPYEHTPDLVLVEILGQMKIKKIFNKELATLYKKSLKQLNKMTANLVELNGIRLPN